MNILNLNQTQFVSGGEGEVSQCSTAYGHYYETPTGEIQFNAFKIVYPDGQVLGLGCIPDGWKQISDEVVVINHC